MASRNRTHNGKLTRPPAPPPEPQKPPLQRRHLVGPGQALTSLEVFCPSQEATVSAERCAFQVCIGCCGAFGVATTRRRPSPLLPVLFVRCLAYTTSFFVP